MRRLTEVLARELEVISIGSEIQSQVQSEMDRTQREFVLRQQLKAIQDELGEFDESAAEANELREQLAALDLPEDVRKQVDRELGRLENLPTQAALCPCIRSPLLTASPTRLSSTKPGTRPGRPPVQIAS